MRTPANACSYRRVCCFALCFIVILKMDSFESCRTSPLTDIGWATFYCSNISGEFHTKLI